MAAESAQEAEGRLLFGLDTAQLTEQMKALGEPGFRGKQLAEALYRQRVENLADITTLGRGLREKMTGEGWQVGRPAIAQVFRSGDGTERFLIESRGGAAQTVEAVWMPEGDDGEIGDGLTEGEEMRVLRSAQDDKAAQDDRGESRKRATICVSSQVGCAVNCQFCLTAKLGWQRNLTAGEIAGQVVAIMGRHQVDVGKDRLNLVFMGMGEPFLNYDNFMGAVRLLVREVGLSPKRMTVSTSGIVPGIERFAEEAAEVRPKLAISLNAPNDVVRAEVMPINRKWPIEAVLDAVRGIRLRHRERITFEYVLLGGVTDQPDHARQVGRLLQRSGLPVKVNLIAWNPGPGITYATPQPEAVENFRKRLQDAGVPTYLRRPRGQDIYAACGQLKRTVEG